MSAFTGTRHLVRLILRRDRLRLPIWIIALTAVTGSSASAVISVYGTPQEIAAYAGTVGDSAASRMMNGRPVALDTIGGIVAYETTMTALVVTALMVIFLVVRHTRAEEESGRAELLRATVTGRHAATAAAVLVAAAASVLVGVLDAAVLLANDLPAAGLAPPRCRADRRGTRLHRRSGRGGPGHGRRPGRTGDRGRSPRLPCS